MDDIVDTAGTLTKAASLMIENGAKSVRAAITHPVLSANAIEKIDKSALKELIVTDTIPLDRKNYTMHEQRPIVNSDKITVLTATNLFAEIIDKVLQNKSISSSFIF